MVSGIELLHQGRKSQCCEDTEGQFASKTWSNDIFEASNAKYIESGATLLPAEERSHSQDGQLISKLEGTEERSHSQDGRQKSKLEGTKVVESSLNFSKDISSVLDNGSVVGTVGERTLYGSGLPNDSSVDYNLRQEDLDGSSVENFLDGSTTYGEKNVSGVGQ